MKDLMITFLCVGCIFGIMIILVCVHDWYRRVNRSELKERFKRRKYNRQIKQLLVDTITSDDWVFLQSLIKHRKDKLGAKWSDLMYSINNGAINIAFTQTQYSYDWSVEYDPNSCDYKVMTHPLNDYKKLLNSSIKRSQVKKFIWDHISRPSSDWDDMSGGI